MDDCDIDTNLNATKPNNRHNTNAFANIADVAERQKKPKLRAKTDVNRMLHQQRTNK